MKKLLIFCMVITNASGFAHEQKCEPAETPTNPSPYLQLGSKIRGLGDKAEWGSLKSRLKTNDGWWLDNGRKALDESYGRKWEVTPPEEKLFDADGKELFGDYDKLWFKTVPPESDKEAYRVYKEVGLGQLSTDGYFNGTLHYLFESSLGMTSGATNASVLKYLSQTNPSTELEPGTKIRGLSDKAEWGRLKSRLSTNKGWWLDNGRKALDESYGRKWEVIPLTPKDNCGNVY